MSKRHCKDGCEFIKLTNGEPIGCLIYKKILKVDEEGILRLDKCVHDSQIYKIDAQMSDIHTYYDAFVCEMDMMFSNLKRLLKGEK